MLEKNIKVISNDIDNLMKDAQALFHSAASTTGDKADDLHKRGMQLVNTAVARAAELQSAAIAGGKVAARSTDTYVRDNPWRAMAVVGALGLLLGLVFSRK